MAEQVEISAGLLANENYPTGAAGYIQKYFVQDEKYQLSNFMGLERTRHDGEDFELCLDPQYLMNVDFQEAEQISFETKEFRNPSWKREYSDYTIQTGEFGKEGFKTILRRKFPLRVTITQGVVYSLENKAVLESFGRIKFIRQQKIDIDAIFKDKIPCTIREPAQARAQAQTMEEMQDISDDAVVTTGNRPLFREPVPFSEPSPSTSRHVGDAVVITARAREPTPSTSHGITFTCGPPAKQAKVVNPASYLELMQAMATVARFFNDDLFREFKVPIDRKTSDIPEVEPDKKHLAVGYRVYHQRNNMMTTNTTKIHGEVYEQNGLTRGQVVIYKSKLALTGQRVPFSLREGSHILQHIVKGMVNGLKQMADRHKEKDLKLATTLEGQEKENFLLNTAAAHAEKLNKIGF